MIINGNAGGALNNLVETSFMLNANHPFYVDGQKQYLEIPNITLSTGIINTVLIYANVDRSTLSNGAIYNLYKTKSEKDTGTVVINGRFYYIDPSGSPGSSPFNPTDQSEFLYDASTHKVRIFIPLYNTDYFIQGNITYQVAIW